MAPGSPNSEPGAIPLPIIVIFSKAKDHLGPLSFPY